MKARLLEAEETGAYAVLMKLEELMKTNKHANKTKTMFQAFDSNGDGQLDVDELVSGLDKYFGGVFTKPETRLLVDFFDEDGDGDIQAHEFDLAIKTLRKNRAKLLELSANTKNGSQANVQKLNKANKVAKGVLARVQKQLSNRASIDKFSK